MSFSTMNMATRPTMAPRPLVRSASTVKGRSMDLNVAGLALYSSVFCMLGMNDARVMRPDANTSEGTWCANWEVKDSPVESSAPRPATKAICATRPLMVSGAQPPKDMALTKLSFMEAGAGATAASTTGSSTDISALATIAARRADLVALTAGRAPRATREERVRDMAIVS